MLSRILLVASVSLLSCMATLRHWLMGWFGSAPGTRLVLLQSQSPGGIRAGRIFAIADDRTFGIGQMHPDLIAPTRLGCQFD